MSKICCGFEGVGGCRASGRELRFGGTNQGREALELAIFMSNMTFDPPQELQIL